jgi:MFS family permease
MGDAARVHALKRRLADVAEAYRTVLRNPFLRRVQIVYGTSIVAEWGALIALAVFAYEIRGAAGVGIVGIVRMLPAAVVTPFAAFLSDRFRRELVLLWVELASAAAMAASAVAYFAGRSEFVIYALAGLLAIFSTLLRPTVAALLPSLATTPEELIAANGASLTTESLGTLVGPLLGGVIVGAANAGVVFAGAACIYAVAALLLRFVRVEKPLGPSPAGKPAEELLGGFRVVALESQPRLLVALFAAQTLVRGSLNVLIVVLAFRLLHAGGSWVGFLTAALGAGGLVGAFASVALTGRRLAAPFGVGLLLWGLPIAALGLWPNKVSALVLLAIVGVGNSLEDVGGFTLLQRIVRDEVLARVLGVVWGLAMAGVGIGSVVGPPLIHAVGTRGAAAATGLFLSVLVALSWRRLVAIDRAVTLPTEQLAAIGKVPMFRGLSVVAKERLASSLIPLSFPAGASIVEEGETGDRFYIVVQGAIEARERGRPAGRGSLDYFGEIALLRDVPRTATVTARTPVQVYALDRDDFLTAVTGYSGGREAGESVVAERLATSPTR